MAANFQGGRSCSLVVRAHFPGRPLSYSPRGLFCSLSSGLPILPLNPWPCFLISLMKRKQSGETAHCSRHCSHAHAWICVRVLASLCSFAWAVCAPVISAVAGLLASSVFSSLLDYSHQLSNRIIPPTLKCIFLKPISAFSYRPISLLSFSYSKAPQRVVCTCCSSWTPSKVAYKVLHSLALLGPHGLTLSCSLFPSLPLLFCPFFFPSFIHCSHMDFPAASPTHQTHLGLVAFALAVPSSWNTSHHHIKHLLTSLLTATLTGKPFLTALFKIAAFHPGVSALLLCFISVAIFSI